jgi:hypothetical protein
MARRAKKKPRSVLAVAEKPAAANEADCDAMLAAASRSRSVRFAGENPSWPSHSVARFTDGSRAPPEPRAAASAPASAPPRATNSETNPATAPRTPRAAIATVTTAARRRRRVRRRSTSKRGSNANAIKAPRNRPVARGWAIHPITRAPATAVHTRPRRSARSRAGRRLSVEGDTEAFTIPV